MSPPPSSLDDERRPLLQAQKVNGTQSVTPDEEHALADEPGDQLTPEPTNWECFKVMVGVWLGTFLAALDSTIVATLSAAISDSFDSLSLLSWVATGYLIANAAIQPVSGKLTDIYGRRAGFMFAIVFFCAGNIICALAQSSWVMIMGRLVAGAGGGCLNTISTFVASDMIPLRKRGVWQGIGNINYGIGLALGGVIGGFVNDIAGWRWAFGFQVPLTLICAIQVWFTVKIPVKETEGSRLRRVDFLGSFVLVISLVLLLLGLNSGGNIVPWNHPLVFVSLPLSAAFLAGFVYVEAKVAQEPIIPMKQLSVRTVLSACFTNWFGSMACLGLVFYAPIYFQIRGDSTSAAGAKLVPFSVGVALGSISVGIVMKLTGKYYWLNVAVMTLFIGAFAAQSSLQPDTPVWPFLVILFIIGFGHSSLLTITLTAFVAAVEHQYQAVMTSASYAFRSTGSSIGITICSAIFQNILVHELWDQLGQREGADKIIPKVRERLDYVKQLDPSWREPILNIYMDAMRGVFLTVLGMAVMAALVSLWMREHRLHTNLARRESA